MDQFEKHGNIIGRDRYKKTGSMSIPFPFLMCLTTQSICKEAWAPPHITWWIDHFLGRRDAIVPQSKLEESFTRAEQRERWIWGYKILWIVTDHGEESVWGWASSPSRGLICSEGWGFLSFAPLVGYKILVRTLVLYVGQILSQDENEGF